MGVKGGGKLNDCGGINIVPDELLVTDEIGIGTEEGGEAVELEASL